MISLIGGGQWRKQCSRWNSLEDFRPRVEALPEGQKAVLSLNAPEDQKHVVCPRAFPCPINGAQGEGCHFQEGRAMK